MPIIEVEHLTKEYRLGALQSLKQTMLNAGARLIGRAAPERPLFKALDDVSFTIEQGEVVGIIGHNGAGKSTLLKMLARISTPTRGSVKVNGRIAPLIEVGAGFVPDFTGRENVYLNGAILGMSKREIDRKFDEIVDFAEMAEFIDTPVKRYSSGMQVKLAFSVATSVESEILIVDEVLAVGDLAFQRKCFDRMENLIKRQGRTVLIVSHNIRQIERMCNRVLLLDHGTIKVDGNAKLVCNVFFEQSDVTIIAQQDKGKASNALTTGEADLLDLNFTDPTGQTIDTIEYNAPANIRFKIRAHREIRNPIFFIGFHTTDFIYLTASITPGSLRKKTLSEGTHEFSMRIDNFPLLPGAYATRLSIDVEEPIKNIFYADNLCHFRVTSSNLQRSSPECQGGFFSLEAHWSHQHLLQEPVDARHLQSPLPLPQT
ncbi:ABC transporter ATP-binding protein [Aromatoleum evansii]|uniref:ABC transporter ATP-binding protein n=1 Tax=Aromatoleum evansii TaxID=59406 RepID=UPI00145DEB22|nr:ABC transporter ATP-binding protein [Aromatoleum evansii]NMG28281.1 ATP-binding cassette domain-containing protein [Aromatoleum evansii]